MQFHEKKIDLYDFTSFFAWTFLNFLAHSGIDEFLQKFSKGGETLVLSGVAKFPGFQ